MMTKNEDELNHIRIPRHKITLDKKLEDRGYGSVYEGTFGDQRVVLKQLNFNSFGSEFEGRLLDEILMISRVQEHPNLVALLGFCDDENSHEIILVYPYVSGGNLEDKMRKLLTTIQRLEICLGAARGLAYLHTDGIVHGSLLLSKIMLNSNSNSTKFEAKVTSFGLSKQLPGQPQSTVNEIKGRMTKENDVYSFGVLLLEVLCGVSEQRALELVRNRKLIDLRNKVHPNLKKEIKTESLETYANIACQCVSESPENRPSMAHVVTELEKALILQGGEVSDVQIVGSRTENGTVIDPPELDDARKVAVTEVSAPENHSPGKPSANGSIKCCSCVWWRFFSNRRNRARRHIYYIQDWV